MILAQVEKSALNAQVNKFEVNLFYQLKPTGLQKRRDKMAEKQKRQSTREIDNQSSHVLKNITCYHIPLTPKRYKIYINR